MSFLKENICANSIKRNVTKFDIDDTSRGLVKHTLTFISIKPFITTLIDRIYDIVNEQIMLRKLL